MVGKSENFLPEVGQVFLGFSTQKGAISWFIRRATRSLASHSFLVYFSEEFRQHMVLEVQGRGFVLVPWSDWRRQNRLLALYKIRRSAELIEQGMCELGKRLGDPYDNYSLLGFLLIYVFCLWERNDLDDKEKLVCSEMVALFLRWCDVPLRDHIDRVVPKDLWCLADSRPEDFELRLESRSGGKRLGKIRKQGKDLRDPVRCACVEAS